MTDIATLAMKIDAREVTPAAAALDKLTAAGQKAEQQTSKLGITTEQAERHMRKASIVLGDLKKQEEAAALAASKLAQAQQTVAVAGNRVAISAGQQRAGMQQLSYQIGDVAQQFALGARPMQIFAAQGTQVIQALQMMSTSSRGLIGFLSGPWGAVIIGAATVAGTLAASLLDAEAATKQVEFATYQFKDAQSILGSVMDLTTGKINTQSAALIALARAQAVAGQIEARRQRAAAGEALDDLRSPKFTMTQGPRGFFLGSTGPEAQVVSAFQDGTLSLKEAERGLRSLMETGLITEKVYLDAAKAVTDFGVASENISVFENLGKALDGDTEATQQFLNVSKKAAGAHRDRAAAVSEEEKAYKAAYEAANEYISNLGDQISKVGLNAIEVRKLEAARAADAAATKGQATTILLLSENLEKAIANQEYLNALRNAKQDTSRLQEELAALDREAKVMGEVGWIRERHLLTLEQEAEIRPLLVKIADAELKGEVALAEEYRKQIDLLNRRYEVKIQGGDAAERLDREAEAARQLNDQYRDMARLLDQLGGAGSILGSLLAITSGNYNSVASGPLGDVLAYMLNQSDTDGKKIGETLKVGLEDVFRDIFGAKGLFGKTLSETLQGAGLGMSAGRAILGDRGTGGDIGSAIGGILGQAAGEAAGKAIGGILGKIGGPLGAIAGGLLGSLIGGIFGGPPPPAGQARISNGTVSISGNDSERKQAANEMAGAVNDGLKAIADQLGIGVGDYLVSIGVYKDQFRVNFSGAAINGNRNGANGDRQTYASAEEAIAAAIRDAIKDGALAGARAGTLALLQAEGDLQEQVRKALMFEQVFKDVAAASNPFKAEMEALTKQFDELTKIFAEAKATTAEYATLQEWLTLKQKELIEQASATYRSTFYTDEQNVAYAKQQINATLTPLGFGSVDTVEEYKALVEATDALANPELYGTLMGLADEFGVLKDAADNATQAAEAAAAAEKALAAQRGQLQVEILRAQGKEAEALAKQRQMELDAADESLRPLLRELYKAQDIATSRNALTEAYKRESEALQDVIDDAARAADKLRAFRDSLSESGSAAASTNSLLARLMSVGALAGSGDLTAADQLPGAGQAYLDALRNSASSYTQYRRGVATVRGYTDQALAAVEGKGSLAAQQLETMKTQVGALVDINESVLSVADAIQQLNSLMGGAGGNSPNGPTSGGQSLPDALSNLGDRFDGVFDRFRDRFDRADRINTNVLDRLNAIESFWRKMTRDGTSLIVATDDDSPLAVSP